MDPDRTVVSNHGSRDRDDAGSSDALAEFMAGNQAADRAAPPSGPKPPPQACDERGGRAAVRGGFVVGQRVEALLGAERVCTGGVVCGDNGGNGTYWVVFDGGHEFAAVDGALLCAEVTKAEVLAEQLAQLQWRKMQNEASIRRALKATRAAMEADVLRQLSVDRAGEKAAWMAEVIEDELSRPLEVSEDFMRSFEAGEALEQERLEASNATHVRGVKHLVKTVVKRGATAASTAASLTRKANELAEAANELHNKIIQTRHILEVDYYALPANELDGNKWSSLVLPAAC